MYFPVPRWRKRRAVRGVHGCQAATVGADVDAPVSAFEVKYVPYEAGEYRLDVHLDGMPVRALPALRVAGLCRATRLPRLPAAR